MKVTYVKPTANLNDERLVTYPWRWKLDQNASCNELSIFVPP
jgi:hypothetical protein